jgi:hypothetical protein
MRPLGLLLLLAVPSAAPAMSADLGSSAERFAGAPVQLDPRLAQRICPPSGFRFGWAGQAVEARCPATGERLVLPLAMASGPARLKRGDSIQADYVGKGFRVSVGAVAEDGGRDGQMTLRNSRSGHRFAARLDQSGRMIVPGAGD